MFTLTFRRRDRRGNRRHQRDVVERLGHGWRPARADESRALISVSPVMKTTGVRFPRLRSRSRSSGPLRPGSGRRGSGNRPPRHPLRRPRPIRTRATAWPMQRSIRATAERAPSSSSTITRVIGSFAPGPLRRKYYQFPARRAATACRSPCDNPTMPNSFTLVLCAALVLVPVSTQTRSRAAAPPTRGSARCTQKSGTGGSRSWRAPTAFPKSMPRRSRRGSPTGRERWRRWTASRSTSSRPRRR